MEVSDRDVRIAAIKSSLDKMLGQEGSDLIFKTLKLVYHMDLDVIVSDPTRFEQILRRMLGRSAYVFSELYLEALEKDAKDYQ